MADLSKWFVINDYTWHVKFFTTIYCCFLSNRVVGINFIQLILYWKIVLFVSKIRKYKSRPTIMWKYFTYIQIHCVHGRKKMQCLFWPNNNHIDVYSFIHWTKFLCKLKWAKTVEFGERSEALAQLVLVDSYKPCFVCNFGLFFFSIICRCNCLSYLDGDEQRAIKKNNNTNNIRM